jgi:hypothetical protein
MVELARNPDAFAKLQKGLETIPKDASASQIDNLTYVDALLMETMRV